MPVMVKAKKVSIFDNLNHLPWCIFHPFISGAECLMLDDITREIVEAVIRSPKN